MHMTDSDIRTSFRNAKDKASQVNILAELNAVSPQHMRDYLEGLGLKVPDRPPAKPAAKSREPQALTLREMQQILGQFSEQYPDAIVRIPGGCLSGVTVTLTYALSGEVAAAEICLKAGGKSCVK